MQSRQNPDLFKVGFTTRKTTERRAELNRFSGKDMKIVSTVSMPWARKCEALLLRRLRRNPFRKRSHLGTEWFHLRPKETIEDIATNLFRSSQRIMLISKLKLSWPKGVLPRKFKALGTFSRS